MIAALIFLAVVSYTVAILAFSQGPKFLDGNLLGAVINFVGVIVPVIFLYTAVKGDGKTFITIKGIIIALAGGAGIGFFTFALTRLFASGQNVGYVTALVYGGSVLLASLAGAALFKERPTVHVWSGLLLITAGILLISYSSYLKGVK